MDKKGLRKIGDWGKVSNLINNISREMEMSRRTCLSQWGLKAEGIAKTHISKQDLGWSPLRAKTLATKKRKGLSDQILVATSTYFQNITSWTDLKTSYAGVKREVVYDDGQRVFEIARALEFGSKSIKNKLPARPLWQPTFKETVEWINKGNSPVNIFLSKIRKY